VCSILLRAAEEQREVSEHASASTLAAVMNVHVSVLALQDMHDVGRREGVPVLCSVDSAW